MHRSSDVVYSNKLEWVARAGQLILRRASVDRKSGRITIFVDAVRADAPLGKFDDILQRLIDHCLVRREFNEEDHPRDEDGKFTFGGGGGDEATGAGTGDGDGGHPGAGYSASAYVKNGVIHTSSVYDAQRALSEDRKVELSQPHQVTVLIERLGKISKQMIAAGKAAPDFNLCNVTLKGTNLFCADTVGIPRVQMPQMDDQQTKDFRKYLEDKGYKVEKENVHASHLRATQNELHGVKVAGIAAKLRGDPEHQAKRLIVSKDDYILDGHHHWAAKVGLDAEDGNLNNDTKIKIARVNISIIKLLKEAETFTGGKGKVKDWDESKHPREPAGSSDGGQFGSGGGGSESDVGSSKEDNADYKSKLSGKEKDQLRVFGSGEKSWKDKGSYDKIRASKEFGDTLSKLPQRDGTFYRGMVLGSQKEVDELVVGRTVTVEKHSFGSPSRDYAKAYTQLQMNFVKKGTPVVLSIMNATAVDFGKAREAYGEKANRLEVVFSAGSKFKVTSVKQAEFNGKKGFNVTAEYVK